MLVDLPQRSEEWFAARRGKVTASLAGAILGVDPHKGQLAAYNEIMGISHNGDNKHMAWGREFEGQARIAYEAESGNLVTETGLWSHDELPWLAASPDGLIGDDGLVEIKCPSVLPEDVPPQHAVQMAIQMACTDREWCDYFAWNQNGWFGKRVTRDTDHEIAMLLQLGAWYDKHIKAGVAPPRRRTRQ